MATRSTRTSRPARDTGFPEPFDLYSNTTLPHPEADLSPNACITHDDTASEEITRRRRLHSKLLHRNKSRRSTKEGPIDLPGEGEPGPRSTTSSLTPPEKHPDRSTRERSSQPSLTRSSSGTGTLSSKDGGDSGGESVAARDEEGTPPTSPESVRTSKRSSRHVFGIGRWKR